MQIEQLSGFFSEGQALAIMKKQSGKSLNSTERVLFYRAKKKYLAAKKSFNYQKQLDEIFS